MRFVIVDLRQGRQSEIDFADFVELVKGSTVGSAAAGEDFLELGITDAINVRLQSTPDGNLVCSLTSTLNEGDFPPIRIQIVEDGEVPTALVIEQRIRALRQSYAISFLADAERLSEAEDALASNPDADLEALLLDEDRLYVLAAAPGSFWLTVITKSAKAYKTLKHGLALPYREGREALLRRVQADTRLRELAVEEKQLDIGLKRTKGLIDTLSSIDKVKDEQSRKALRATLLDSLQEIGAEDLLALPPPARKSDTSD